MSRHEMPKQLKKNLISLKILSPKTENVGPKKNRAFHIHSKMRRHEMPKQLKERPFNIPKNTESHNGKMLDQNKIGHSALTQR